MGAHKILLTSHLCFTLQYGSGVVLRSTTDRAEVAHTESMSKTTTTTMGSTMLLPTQYHPSMVEMVEIHENERTWLGGGGFSKRGLLPSDRGRYSSADGSVSWPTLDAASAGLLLPGYVWLEQSAFTAVNDDNDNNNNEWWYARDFSPAALDKAQPKKGPLHFVRFRRLVRPRRMEPQSLFQQDDKMTIEDIVGKCSFGDSVVVAQLSQTVLDVLAYLTLLHNPQRCTWAALLASKRKILDILGNADLPYRSVHYYRDPRERVSALQQALQEMAVAERQKPQHLLSKVELFDTRTKDPAWKVRYQEIITRTTTSLHSSVDDVPIWVGWMIRLLDDPEFTLHCAQLSCHDNNSCPFFHVSCSNPGCDTVVSQNHSSEHAAICDHAVIDCEACHQRVPRHALTKHRQEACPLRESHCPFAKIGCLKVCPAQEVPAHVEVDVGGHLLLALDRLMEVQSVVQNLHHSVNSLQQENQQLRRALDGLRQEATQSTTNQQRQVKELRKKMSQLENANRKEFKRMGAELTKATTTTTTFTK